MSKKNSIDSRNQFIEQVATTIQSNLKSPQGEAFIFGLSGKWGEGKTTFLTSLASKLEKNVRIVNVNPWKYAEDRVSFLRAFLKELNETLPYSPFFEEKHPRLNSLRLWLHEYVTKLWRQRKLRPLYDDVSRKRIRVWRLLIITLSIGLVAYLSNRYVLANPDYKSWVMTNKWYITALMLPVFVSLGQSLVTDQKSYHSINTTDEFETLLNKVTKKFKKRTQLIVYVDDLDRVTGQRAVEVLDNLRTFFDKPNIAFIVAGDHTVIERHLGRQLVPESDESTQKDEGRRFLKKIFNVYWRLPLPTSPEMDGYIGGLFGKSSDHGMVLSEVFVNKSEREVFIRQLKTYFAYNFRNVNRFVERVDFTFKVINSQIDNKKLDKTKKPYFQEMLENPLLVVRVLLLEEVANPFYEQVLHDPNLFIELEVALVKGRPAVLDERLNALKTRGILNDEQLTNLRKLLNETPRFYSHLGTTVMSPIPYLLLSSDSSFGDERGLSPKDFVNRVETASAGADYATDAQVAEIKDVVEQSGDAKAQEAAEALLEDINGRHGQAMSLDMPTNLFKALAQAEPSFTVHKIFLTCFTPEVVAELINNLNDDDRKVRIIQAYTDWLHAIGNRETDLQALSDTLEEDDIENFDEETLSNRLSTVIMKWFIASYSASPRTALNALSSVQSALNVDVLEELMPELGDSIVQNLMVEKTSSYGDSLLGLIQRYIPNKIDDLKNAINQQILQEDESVWTWANTSLLSAGVYTSNELDQVLLELIRSTENSSDLQRALLFLANKLTTSDAVWSYIVDNRAEDLLVTIPTLFGRTGLDPLSPNDLAASKIFEAMYAYKLNEPDEYNFLRYIRKDQWYLSRLNRIPKNNKRSVSNRARNIKNNQPLTDELSRILTEWP